MYVDSGPERLVEKSQLSLYIRRWWPSTYEIGPFSELILDDNSIEDLRRKVCEAIMEYNPTPNCQHDSAYNFILLKAIVPYIQSSISVVPFVRSPRHVTH